VDECKPLRGGHGDRHAAVPAGDGARVEGHGKAVQFERIQSVLTEPETKRLKLEYDNLLSIVGFCFNLHHYSTAFGGWKSRSAVPQLVEQCMAGDLPVDHFVTHSIDVEAGDVAAATTKVFGRTLSPC